MWVIDRPRAPIEILQLAREFEELVEKSGLSVPAIRKLLALIPASGLSSWRMK